MRRRAVEAQTVFISLVHNYEHDRLSRILPKLSKLQIGSNQILLKQYSKQTIKNYKFLQVLKHLFFFTWLYIKWTIYLGKKKSWSFIKEVLVIFKPLTGREQYKNFKKRLAITNEATQKHVTLLTEFICSPAVYALVLESDAEIFDVNELEKFLLQVIKCYDLSDHIFGVVGEGLDYSKLGINSIPMLDFGSLYLYDRAFSNTTVAYFLNKKTADLIVKEILQYPVHVPFVGSDWLLNYAFIKLNKKKKIIKCIIPKEAVIGHGSRAGSSESWQHKFS